MQEMVSSSCPKVYILVLMIETDFPPQHRDFIFYPTSAFSLSKED